MNVVLLTHTPIPEQLVTLAAKLCYSDSNLSDLCDKVIESDVEKYLNMLTDLGHESPFEHVSFTFGVESISRACSHQLVRHRIASYSQKSQRYVNEDTFQFIIPPAIRDAEYGMQIFGQAMQNCMEEYRTLKAILIKYHKEHTFADLPAEEAQSKAEKLANEDARFVLPNACATSIIVTMNVRSLWNFFKHRCCNRAQWEIRELANKMLDLCIDEAPGLFAKAGPACYTTGRCPEGKMTCGKPYSRSNA